MVVYYIHLLSIHLYIHLHTLHSPPTTPTHTLPPLPILYTPVYTPTTPLHTIASIPSFCILNLNKYKYILTIAHIDIKPFDHAPEK